mmetsp:Transcript_74459/g.231008  ORF Transcript_74459/g.231008 Transcript_74459/m.231008 type:complete len:207 (+) Transcript_74459:1-621(+)
MGGKPPRAAAACVACCGQEGGCDGGRCRSLAVSSGAALLLAGCCGCRPRGRCSRLREASRCAAAALCSRSARGTSAGPSLAGAGQASPGAPPVLRPPAPCSLQVRLPPSSVGTRPSSTLLLPLRLGVSKAGFVGGAALRDLACSNLWRCGPDPGACSSSGGSSWRPMCSRMYWWAASNCCLSSWISLSFGSRLTAGWFLMQAACVA